MYALGSKWSTQDFQKTVVFTEKIFAVFVIADTPREWINHRTYLENAKTEAGNNSFMLTTNKKQLFFYQPSLRLLDNCPNLGHGRIHMEIALEDFSPTSKYFQRN